MQEVFLHIYEIPESVGRLPTSAGSLSIVQEVFLHICEIPESVGRLPTSAGSLSIVQEVFLHICYQISRYNPKV